METFINLLSLVGSLALFLYGMKIMSEGLEKFAGDRLRNILSSMTRNRFMGVLTGSLITAIIQSSSASVGVLQALSMTGAITYGSAIPIIMGQNIGTCVSALLAAFGASKNAKRVAMVHILFNSIGSVICLTVWLIADAIFNFAFTDTAVEPFNIAILHSIFNVVTTVMLFPFSKLLEKLVKEEILVTNVDAKRKTGDLTVKNVRLAVSENEAEGILKSLTPKQRSVVNLLLDIGGASVKEVCYFTGVTPAVINAIVKKGYAELSHKP